MSSHPLTLGQIMGPALIVTRGDLLEKEPSTEVILGNSRCECCGLTRHLSTAADGRTFCMHCQEPPSDAQPSIPVPAPEVRVPAPPCRAREPHPLASLIREHQVLGELAEALESFSTCVQAQPTGYDRADLASFARARPGAVSTGTFTERKYPVVSRHPAAYELERAAALAGGAPHL